ncbi:MAG: DinB family protein [Bacteroidetes bacterium]|nr:DinB family protein [Bacteroidota bacterium]MBS1650306.1 DinB family protein [Bacteroidota bacterium]
MSRPSSTHYASYYTNYIEAAQAENVAELITNYSILLNNFIQNIPEEKANYKYAANKWNVKEVLQHLIDTERIFAYRALRIARNDSTLLAGFDENSYVENANTIERTLQSLKNELIAVRKSTDLLLQSFNEKQLQQVGTANNHSITVNAICFIIFGHLLHHKKILEERYNVHL